MTFFGSDTLNATTQVVIDRTGHADGSLSRWEYAGNVTAMYWATLFAHPVPARQQDLYLLGVSGADQASNRNIVISRSSDLGVTWTDAVPLFRASNKDGSYHCAPTPVLVASDGRLYRAFETTIKGGRGRQALIISTRTSVTNRTNLLDPATWIKSSSVDPGAAEDASLFELGWNQSARWSWEEGNAVESPSGEIFNVIRIDGQTIQNNTQNKAGVLRLSTDGKTLRFDKMINFPSCSSKFVIRRDPVTKLYLTLSTDATQSAIAQDTVFARNHLVLAASADLYHWDTCYVVLMDDTGLSSVDSARYTGFHYVDWIFTGTDMLMAIRTGYRGSNSYHNANRLTTLRIANYSRFVSPVDREGAHSHATSVCAHDWHSSYAYVGRGWCRPTDGFVRGGFGRSDMDCAQSCSDAEKYCQSFAIKDVDDANYGVCVLYPLAANTSGGKDGTDVRCYTKQ